MVSKIFFLFLSQINAKSCFYLFIHVFMQREREKREREREWEAGKMNISVQIWMEKKNSSLVQTQYLTREISLCISHSPLTSNKKKSSQIMVDKVTQSKIPNKDSDNSKRTSKYGSIVVLSSIYKRPKEKQIATNVF